MSTERLFGTDGVRGAFGHPPLVRLTVTALGYELARMLADDAGDRPLVVLGGDTRDSTPTIESWLAAGIGAGGGAWRSAGMVPTPAVVWLTGHLGAAAGIAVSASHNPHPDNGIKVIGGDGFKWPEERERELERRIARHIADAGPDPELPAPPAIEAAPELAAAWIDHLASGAGAGRPLAGLRLVVDAGNGAASPYAAPLLRRLGAEVEALGDAPDGRNINAGCGSTRPETMAAATAAGGYHLGVAFDGDADRALFADERGAVRDGDAVLYLWARELAAESALDPAAIVATSMSNLGLERALADAGIGVVRCDVGDRVVVETLRREGLRLGGEQSGHIVDLERSSTGDGLLTALSVATIAARRKRPLSELLAGFRRYPQVLVNVEVARKPELSQLPAVAAESKRVRQELGDDGRLVLRYSGTEPLARIMIEGPEQAAVEELAARLAAVIEQEIGG